MKPCATVSRFMTRMTILSLIVIAMFLKLGFWQLKRAHEKQALIDTAVSQVHQPFKFWQAGDPIPQIFDPLQVQGKFLKETFLLDNQPKNHRWGYQVLSLFALSSGGAVLIDRGWIAQQEGEREKLPEIQIPTGTLVLHGQAFMPSTKGFLLGDILERQEDNILVVEKIDLPAFSKILHKPLYPFIIRLNKSEAYGYERTWPVVNMTPARHKAYAFQWFAMAVIVILLYGNLYRRHRYRET